MSNPNLSNPNLLHPETMTHKPNGKGVAKASVSAVQKSSVKVKKSSRREGVGVGPSTRRGGLGPNTGRGEVKIPETGRGGVAPVTGRRGVDRGSSRSSDTGSGGVGRGATRIGVRTRGGYAQGLNLLYSAANAPGPKGKQAATSNVSPRADVTGPVNGFGTPPTPGAISQVGGTCGNVGGSSTSHNSSQNTASASVSRTRQPSQFPPATQPPLSQQHTPLGPPPQAYLQAPFEDEGEDDGEFPDDDLHVEGDEEEPPVINPIGEDYQVLLDNLMHLPGREQLLRLSDHPIPNVETTW